MLAQSAMHEAAGSSRAAAAPDGAVAKGKGKKKSQAQNLLAGLFANVFAQAQKGIEAKHLEAKAPSKIATKGETHNRPLGALGAPGAEVKKAGAKSAPSLSPKDPGALAQPKGPTTLVPKGGADRRQQAAKAPHRAEELAAAAEVAAWKAAEGGKRHGVAPERGTEELLAGIRTGRGASKPGPALASAVQGPKPAVEEKGDSVEEKKKAKDPREGSKLSVLDLRSPAARKEASAKAAAAPEQKAEDLAIKDGGAKDSRPAGRGHELVKDLSLDLGQVRDSSFPPKGEKDAKVARGQDFQSMLSDRLRDAWNGEIVKSAHIVLRDGDSGTIRLRLKPESLGNVKVELNLADNSISGKILVESDEAKTAFERNMNQLADAFRQGGFDSARLEVAVGGGSQQGSQGRGYGESAGPFYSERLRAAVGSVADPATAVSAYARRGGAVDILA